MALLVGRVSIEVVAGDAGGVFEQKSQADENGCPEATTLPFRDAAGGWRFDNKMAASAAIRV